MYYKKLLAVVLAATMVLGSSAMVFAADKKAETTGSGSTEYVAVGDVFDVVFPTVAEGDTTFDYIVDPESLIQKTNADKYGNKKFEENGTVFFQRTGVKPQGTDMDGNAGVNLDYTVSSNEIRVTNKSTEDVNIEVTAKVDEVAGIKMVAAKSDLAGETEPALYLGLTSRMIDNAATGAPDEVEQAITVAGTVSSPSIPCDENAYEVQWVDNPTNPVVVGQGQYEKAMTAAAKAPDYTGFTSYSFYLTGACNEVSGWAELKDKAPQVDLVWTVTDFVANSGTAASAITTSGTSDILVRLVSGETAVLSKITSAKVNNTEVAKSNIAVSGSGNVWLKGVASAAGTYNVTIVYDGKTYSATLKK